VYKIDLHTHSVLSHDGGITAKGYREVLKKKILNVVAITDHNEINFAKSLKKSLGKKIIIGEEVATGKGEIIGLYLEKRVKPNLGLEKTISLIKKQNGLIYIPHPFEKRKKGINTKNLKSIHKYIDILEIYNQRSIFVNKKAVDFSKKYKIAATVTSDAHCKIALGKTHIKIDKAPTKSNLLSLLRQAETIIKKPTIKELFCPKLNKLNKLLNVK
jgi:predicted metal-dependent phosphoesterase TrpH